MAGTANTPARLTALGNEAAVVVAGTGSGLDGVKARIVAAIDPDTGKILAAGDTPDQWAITHAPAANTTATATKAAVAGTRHVARTLVACLASDGNLAAVAKVGVQILDGVTVVWNAVLSLPNVPGSAARVELGGLKIRGSVNTLMTVAFTGAGGAGTFESVSLTGTEELA